MQFKDTEVTLSQSRCKMKSCLMRIIFVALCSQVTIGQECDSACCEAGGWCGDPVFEDCNDGRWDYSIRCVPSFFECCLPNNPATTTTTSSTTTDSTTTDSTTTDSTTTDSVDPTGPTPEPTETTTTPPNECEDECCEVGGWCGDPVWEECDNGSWDYGIGCTPFFLPCCRPFTPAPTADPSASTTTTPPIVPDSCGDRPIEAAGKYIVGGEEAEPNSWPWAVSVELDYFEIGFWEHYCGGVLLNNQWVVTAAHCIAKSSIDDPQFYRVILRMHNKQNKEPDVLTVGVSKMIYHEDYSTSISGSPYDVGLLKLSELVEFDEKMSPVCLPESQDYDFMDHQCYITGWGLTKGTADENVLNEALIDVITNELCDFKWEEGSGRVDLIKENHICVGNGGPNGPGACNGDSGGPLQCLVENTEGNSWVLAGVTSFGASGCVAEDAPDVYTRISHFVDWLQDTMENN